MQASQPEYNNKKQKLYYSIAVGASVLYLFLTFSAPPASNTFGFSPLQILLLKTTIALPYIATWILGVYGLSTLERYIDQTKEKNDGVIKLLSFLRTGILWILIGTIFVALLGGIRTAYFAENTNIRPLFTIATNYLYVFPQLIGFVLIYKGVARLHAAEEMSQHKHTSYLFTTFVVFLISCIYVFLLATNPTRQFSSDPALPATYYLPDILILLTIVIPILASWWLGFSAAFTMSDLIPHLTRAELFKGITRIVYGIWAIIFTSIIIQALLSLGGTRLYDLGIGIILLIVYIFITLQGIGYLFIALGSNTLRKSIPT